MGWAAQMLRESCLSIVGESTPAISQMELMAGKGKLQ